MRCPAGCATRIPRLLPEVNVVLQALLDRRKTRGGTLRSARIESSAEREGAAKMRKTLRDTFLTMRTFRPEPVWQEQERLGRWVDLARLQCSVMGVPGHPNCDPSSASYVAKTINAVCSMWILPMMLVLTFLSWVGEFLEWRRSTPLRLYRGQLLQTLLPALGLATLAVLGFYIFGFGSERGWLILALSGVGTLQSTDLLIARAASAVSWEALSGGYRVGVGVHANAVMQRKPASMVGQIKVITLLCCCQIMLPLLAVGSAATNAVSWGALTVAKNTSASAVAAAAANSTVSAANTTALAAAADAAVLAANGTVLATNASAFALGYEWIRECWQVPLSRLLFERIFEVMLAILNLSPVIAGVPVLPLTLIALPYLMWDFGMEDSLREVGVWACRQCHWRNLPSWQGRGNCHNCGLSECEYQPEMLEGVPGWRCCGSHYDSEDPRCDYCWALRPTVPTPRRAPEDGAFALPGHPDEDPDEE